MKNMTLTSAVSQQPFSQNMLFAMVDGSASGNTSELTFHNLFATLLQDSTLVHELQELSVSPLNFKHQPGILSLLGTSIRQPITTQANSSEVKNASLQVTIVDWGTVIKQISTYLQSLRQQLADLNLAGIKLSPIDDSKNQLPQTSAEILNSPDMDLRWIGVPLMPELVEGINRLLKSNYSPLTSTNSPRTQKGGKDSLSSVKNVTASELPLMENNSTATQSKSELVKAILWVSPQQLTGWNTTQVIDVVNQSAPIVSQLSETNDVQLLFVDETQSRAMMSAGQTTQPGQEPVRVTGSAESVFLQLFSGAEPDLGWLNSTTFLKPPVQNIIKNTIPPSTRNGGNQIAQVNDESNQSLPTTTTIAAQLAMPSAQILKQSTAVGEQELGMIVTPENNGSEQPRNDNNSVVIQPQLKPLLGEADLSTTLRKNFNLENSAPINRILQAVQVATATSATHADPAAAGEEYLPSESKAQRPLIYLVVESHQPATPEKTELIQNNFRAPDLVASLPVDSQYVALDPKSTLIQVTATPQPDMEGPEAAVNSGRQTQVIIQIDKNLLDPEFQKENRNVGLTSASTTPSQSQLQSIVDNNRSLLSQDSEVDTAQNFSIQYSELREGNNNLGTFTQPWSQIDQNSEKNQLVMNHGAESAAFPTMAGTETSTDENLLATQVGKNRLFIQIVREQISSNLREVNKPADLTLPAEVNSKNQTLATTTAELTPAQQAAFRLILEYSVLSGSVPQSNIFTNEQKSQSPDHKAQQSLGDVTPTVDEVEPAAFQNPATVKSGFNRLVILNDMKNSFGEQENLPSVTPEKQASTTTVQAQGQNSEKQLQNNPAKSAEAENYSTRSPISHKPETESYGVQVITSKKASELTKSTDIQLSRSPLLLEQSVKQVFDQIVRSVRYQMEPGKNQLQVQLKPEYLGLVQIVVENNGSEVRGTVYVERLEVRQALEVQLPAIHRSLQDQQIKLDQLNVQDFSAQFTNQDHSEMGGNRSKPAPSQSPTAQNHPDPNEKKYSDLHSKTKQHKRYFGYNSLELTI